MVWFTGNPLIFTAICWNTKSIHPQISIPNYARYTFSSYIEKRISAQTWLSHPLPCCLRGAVAISFDIPIDWNMHAICIVWKSRFKNYFHTENPGSMFVFVVEQRFNVRYMPFTTNFFACACRFKCLHNVCYALILAVCHYSLEPVER